MISIVDSSTLSSPIIVSIEKTLIWAMALFSILFSVQVSADTHSVSLMWSDAPYAEFYKLEEKAPGSQVFLPVLENIASPQALLKDKPQGQHIYRVVGCVKNVLVTPAKTLCEEVAEYSNELLVDVGTDSIEHRVIFIHTDLLGSPAAETDEQGKVLQQ